MPGAHSRSVRQWRITITEEPQRGRYLVALAWRTFPSRASDWDGVQYHQMVLDPSARISSPEDLEAVLARAVDGEWWPSVRAAQGSPDTHT